MGLRGRDFIGGTLREVIGTSLDASLWAANSDGTGVEVATLATRAGTDLDRQATIDVAGRQWTLRTAAATRTLAGSAALPLLASGGGTLLSLLLAGLVLVLATGRARAEATVTTATAELRAADPDARRQAGLFAAVVGSISDGVTVVDEHGANLLRNPAANALVPTNPLVQGPDDWQARYGIYHLDGTTPFRTDEQPLVRALTGESVDDVEMLVRNPDGPVLLSVSSRPLLPGAGQAGAVAVFRDITAEHEHEAELAGANEKLAEANGELEAFSYSVSHDLRVPLRAIDGFACILAEDYAADLPAEAGGYLIRIQQAVARMAALIDDLLAFSHLGRRELTTRQVDPADAARAAAAELAHQHTGRNLTISIADLPSATADTALLKQVYVNLLSNAIKFSRDRDPATITVGSHTDTGQTVYTVTDNGAGFDPLHADKLFGVFQRLHRSEDYEGTGVGLALAHRIIHRHGGRIWADSEPGNGATFSFTLPPQ
jgi:signal transduction histidine kinase